MNAPSAGSEFARSAQPKELIAVAARCNLTTICSNTRSIRGAREPSKRGPADLYDTHSAELEGGRPYDDGGRMSWNMFSRFGAGSDPDIVSFGDLEEAVGTHAWTIVDVREPHEFAAGHVPNALNMPMSSYDPKDLPEGKPVVLICQSGGRSRNALNKARMVGREDVRHFAEGMNGWRSHNGPVTL
jgi:rhodanese-related sulfurtransferase